MKKRVPPFAQTFKADFVIALVMSTFASFGTARFFSGSPLPLAAVLIVCSIFWSALTFSAVLAAAQTWVFPYIKFRSFAVTILATSLAYLVVILVGIPLGVAGTAALAQHDQYSLIAAQKALGVVLQPAVILMAWGLMVLITMYFMVSKKMGPGVLTNWMLGRYYRPREEQRVFMFLDLRDSTKLGEELGDMKFSRLIQQFFEDMSDPVLKTHGEVSHYIGDEAVLCWKLDKGLKNANVLKCFFLMREAIAQNAEGYRAEFGVVPDFKAGAHVGTVVATQVGEIKSEIVYHGDVLNTTARTQGLCNELGSEFLVTRTLADALGTPTGYVLTPMGRHSMKGKEHDVELLAVHEA